MNPLKYFLLVGAIFCFQVTGGKKEETKRDYDKELAEDLLLERGLTVYEDDPPNLLFIYSPEADKIFDENGCLDLGYNIIIKRICPCCMKNHFGLPIPTEKPKRKHRREKDPYCMGSE